MEVVDRGELRLAGILVVGRRSELAHRAPMAWLELVERFPDAPRYYGVFHDADHAAAGTYRYWVCVEAEPVDGLVEVVVPAGRFVKGTVCGGPEQVDATYRAVAEWIGAHAAPSDGLGFELYEPGRQAVTPPYERFDYDVYRPIAAS